MYRLFGCALFAALAVGSAAPALYGDPLAVGFISLDSTGVGNDATFDIANETSANSSGDPTFPITTALSITNLSLTVNFQNGGTVTENSAQFSPDGSGGFTGNFSFDLSSFSIASADLTGTLSPTAVQLYNGTNGLIAPAFSTIVTPSSGATLQAGDSAIIDATTIPEPGSFALLGLGFGALLFFFRKTRKIRNSFRCALPACLVLAVSTASAQVKLNATAQPSTGYAGVTVENVTGSGFPAGVIAPANVTVSLAASCNGAASATAPASSVTTIAGSTRRVSFSIPAAAPPAAYAVSVSGKTSGGSTFSTTTCSTLTVLAADTFLESKNGVLLYNGVPFRFGGGNTYELMYSPQAAVNQVLQTAVNDNLKVVRTWGWLDIGALSGTGSIRGPQNGVYFQYWNGSEPAYNDGANGLQMLDYEIAEARKLGLKLIIPFTNNWTDFGGMDQYVEWAGDQYHDQFYTDPKIRQWYKNWISHLLNRVNTVSGIAYKNDPTIAIWELANEPRCSGSGTGGGGYPTSNSCSSQTLLTWIGDVASYIKSVDSNHLVSVGDEGFFCTNPSSNDFTENCSTGVDSTAFAETPGIDLMGFHLYPEGWGKTTAWAETYVEQHLSDAKTIGKPAYLGEYGLLSGNTRNTAYREWTDTVLNQGGSGALFWDLVTGEPGAPSAEANSSFDLYDGAPLLITMRNFAASMTSNTELPFPPVADDQWATTPFNQAVTLNPLQNDFAYAGASVEPLSIDLDPATAGQQTSINVYGGQFNVMGKNVVFTPTAGFNGATQASYTIEDSNHNLSNVAYLNVTVNPSQTGSLTLESFETGTDGWGPINASSGTVAQSTVLHTDGTHSLQVNSTGGGWFGVSFPSAVNLSGRPTLSIDVQSTGMGGSTAIAFQSGSGYTWCQTQDPWPTLTTNSVTTLTLPLTASQLNCGGGTPDLTDVETVFVYLNGPGTFYLDYLRAAPVVNPKTPVVLFSFETGTQGWQQVNPNGGTVQQTSAFHTDGNYGLEIDATAGDWFGGALSSPVDLTGKTTLSVDLETTTVGTSTDISIETGPNYTWCQGTAFPYVNPSTATTVSINLNLSNLQCYGDGKLYLDQVHVVNVYVNGAGTYYLDNVRAQ